MTDTTDGFEIAERDLQLRGPGDFFGTRQAGVPTFRLIDLVRDHRPARDGASARPRDWLAIRRADFERTRWRALLERAGQSRFKLIRDRVAAMTMLRVIAGALQGTAAEDADLGRAAPDLGPAARDAVQRARRRGSPGARVLDGFAGTGALGIEALSRGAAHVTFIDEDRARRRSIAENLARCGIEMAMLLSAPASLAALETLRASRGTCRSICILLDPPYDHRAGATH